MNHPSVRLVAPGLWRLVVDGRVLYVRAFAVRIVDGVPTVRHG